MNFRQTPTTAEFSDQAAQWLAAVVECAGDPIISQDVRGIVTSWNDAAARLLGYAPEEIIGKPITTILPAEDHAEAALSGILNGDRIAECQTTYIHKGGDFVPISLAASLIRDIDGAPIGVAKILRQTKDDERLQKDAQEEISRRQKAERDLELLLRESHHRIKNTLAMVHAIASQTFQEAPANEKTTFAARLQAMGSAHDLLIKQDWNSVQLQEIVAQTIAPFQNGKETRVSADGPPVHLNANDALFLAIILHELATNAVKYGALSSPAGRIALNWMPSECGGKPHVELVWREADGPEVVAPKRKGFGTTLLRHMHNGDGGKAEIDFDPAGVICRMKVAVASL